MSVWDGPWDDLGTTATITPLPIADQILRFDLWIMLASSAILLPFVAGMAVAYFLDPVADRLEAKGCSRAIATTVIMVGFFAAVIGVIAVLLPLLQHQVVGLVKIAPEVFAHFRAWVEPFLADLQLHLPNTDSQDLREAAGKYGSKVIQWVTGLLAQIWSGGLAFLHVLSLALITPIVSFYLLREWDEIVAWVDSYLPREAAPEIREQARLIDQTMAGFIRGQASVCLTLAAVYGIGLTIVGLNSGLLVGIAAGAQRRYGRCTALNKKNEEGWQWESRKLLDQLVE